MTCARGVSRPLRPLPSSARKQAFIEEIVADALADGLVAQCGIVGEEGPAYALTPEGEAWLRDFPDEMLACYPVDRECGERA